jgi:hypothetical protein
MGRTMNRHISFLRTVFMGTALIVCCIVAPSHAQEEKPVVITGKLVGYGKSSIVVEGEQIDLCEEAEVLDPLERQIHTDGLVATETVSVVIRDGCAIEVKALEIRR